MKSEWNEMKLGDVTKFQQGKQIELEDQFLEKTNEMTRFVRIIDYTSENEAPRYIKVSEESSSYVTEDDVVMIRYGSQTAGKVVMGKSGIIANNMFRVIPVINDLDRKYLYFYLKTPNVYSYLRGGQSSSTMPAITFGLMSSLDIKIPPLSTQKKIAHILSTLDDKIELNRKMNQTLEEMAQALFKSWFVDFDPVHAKANISSDEELETAAKELGISKEILDLFPSEFEESELGMIPKGWSIDKLGSMLVERKENIKPSEYTLSNPYVPIDCITSKSLSLNEAKGGDEAKSSLIKFYQGDIIFGAMRPYFHKVCISPFDGTTRSTAIVLQSSQPLDYSFGLLYLYQDSTIKYATTNSTGTTMPYVKWKNVMENMQIILPNEEIRNKYNELVYPLLQNLQSKFDVQNNLRKIRDTLLPKLLSGELDVSELDLDVE